MFFVLAMRLALSSEFLTDKGYCKRSLSSKSDHNPTLLGTYQQEPIWLWCIVLFIICCVEEQIIKQQMFKCVRFVSNAKRQIYNAFVSIPLACCHIEQLQFF